MGDRGRKSASELQVAANFVARDRPEPPIKLTNAQKSEWIGVVDSLPADWFPSETHGLLTHYCEHKCSADRLTLVINEIELEAVYDEGRCDKLLKMRERETRSATAMARSLRFTLQASYDKERKKPSSIPKPWE